ncbi:MAG: nicotinate-nucleotide adenylyltransferase [Devosia sp.]
MPSFAPRMRIGLFGGSFNPAHEGHRLVALQCLKRLQLDAVWLLVSPGNPLKDHAQLQPLATRVDQTREVMNHHPAIAVTGFEAERGFQYSYQTLEFLTAAAPETRFVWIMGSDNLIDFDRWERWEEIARLLPMAIYARPGAALKAPLSKAATALAGFRLPEEAAETLAERSPPVWVYLHGVMSEQSSTAIRQTSQSSK